MPLRLWFALIVAVLVTGCGGGGAGGSQEAFCDRATEDLRVFLPLGQGTVDPALVGTLRDLAPVAPDELRPALDEATSAAGDEALHEALQTIEGYLIDHCDLDGR